MKKILIISPVGDFGGRELETGFIAQTLSKKYKVHVVSTGNFTLNSQLFNFKGFTVESLIQNIFHNSLFIRLIIGVLHIVKKPKNNSFYSYLQMPYVKKKLRIEQRKRRVLKQLIYKSDLVFIIAQISSNYNKFIIQESNKIEKPLIFRTTGKISNMDINFGYLKEVDLFIHHSSANTNNIGFEHNFKIIDQCSFNEKPLLEIPIINRKVNNFLTIARLEKEKNIDVIIKAFIKNKEPNDKLYIVGDGEDMDRLKLISSDKRIIFTGFLPNSKLVETFNICQCFIVPYYHLEAGPITAIEAMASGLVMISSETGAMPDRFKDSGILWHNNTVNDIYNKIEVIKSYSTQEINSISKQNKKKYQSNYKREIIENEYLNCLVECFEKA